MQQDRVIRFVLGMVVAFGFVMALGCAVVPEEQRKAEEQLAEAAEGEVAEAELAEPAPAGEEPAEVVDIGTLYRQAKEAYDGDDYTMAFKLYQELVGREMELSWWRSRVVKDRFEELNDVLKQLERDKEEAKKAGELFARLATLRTEENWQQAATVVERLRPLEGRLSADQQQQFAAFSMAIFKATDRRAVLSASQVQELALSHFERGMNAYGQGDYATAKAEFDMIDIKGNVQMRWKKEVVDSTLKRLQELYNRGEALYKMGKYEEAKMAFTDVRASGKKCGEAIDAGLQKYLADIDEKIVQSRLASAREYQKNIEQWAPERRKALGSVRAVQEVQSKVLSSLAKARSSMAAGDLEGAKSLLTEAKEALTGVDLAETQLGEASKEVEAQLAVVDEMISQKAQADERRQAAAETVKKLLDEARGLFPEEIEKAELKVVDALQSASESGVELDDEQTQLCDEVRNAVEQKFGPIRGKLRKRYSALMNDVDAYVAVGELEKAGRMLELCAKSKEILLTERQRVMLTGKTAVVRERLEERKDLLSKVEGLAGEAATEQEAGNLQAAVDKYGAAVDVARAGGMPESVLEDLYQKLEVAFSSVVEEAVEKSTAQIKEDVLADLADLRAQRSYLLALRYTKLGSPDLAKPLFEQVAEGDKFSAEQRGLAREQLKGIDARIQTLADEELLNVRQLLARAYELEQQFRQRQKAEDLEGTGALLTTLTDAHVELAVARAKHALQRGALQKAADIMADVDTQGASEKVLMGEYASVAELTKLRQEAAKLLGDAEKAFEDWQVEEAMRALAQVDKMKIPLGPLSVARDQFHEIRQAALNARVAALQVQQNGQDQLAEIGAALAQVRSRDEAWEDYAKATEAFLSQQWEPASEVLDKLLARASGLKTFELAGVRRMDAECRALLKDTIEIRHSDQVAAARKILDEAVELLDSKGYAVAAEKLAALEAMPGFELDRKVRAEASKLAAKIEKMETEAAALYDRAVEASAQDDRGKLAAILMELEADYGETKFFADHL